MNRLERFLSEGSTAIAVTIVGFTGSRIFDGMLEYMSYILIGIGLAFLILAMMDRTPK